MRIIYTRVGGGGGQGWNNPLFGKIGQTNFMKIDLAEKNKSLPFSIKHLGHYEKYWYMYMYYLILHSGLFRHQTRRKSVFRRLVSLVTCGHLLFNLCSTALFLYISHHNYPGGIAMDALHRILPSSEGEL
jgi:hypothetical protein